MSNVRLITVIIVQIQNKYAQTKKEWNVKYQNDGQDFGVIHFLCSCQGLALIHVIKLHHLRWGNY